MKEEINIKSLKTFSPPVLTKCTECGLNFNFVNKHLDKNIYCRCSIPWLLPQNIEEIYMETKFCRLDFTKNMDLPEDSTYFEEGIFSDDSYGIRKNKGNDDSISSKPVLKKQKTNIYSSINAFHDAKKNKCFQRLPVGHGSNDEPVARKQDEHNVDYFSKFKIIKILYGKKNCQISEDELKKMFIEI